MKTFTKWQDMQTRLCRTLGGKWSWKLFGPDGIAGLDLNDRSVIVTAADFYGIEWFHASVARSNRYPSYFDLIGLHKGVFSDGFAYQIFTSAERHISIHQYALHLWGRADGNNVLPDFGKYGTI